MTNDRVRSDDASPAQRSDASLPRSAILRGRNVFTSVFTSGNGVRAGRVVVKYRITPAVNRVLVAGFVMRRGTGNAVRRNRLKRLMREAYRHEKVEFESQLPVGIEMQIVVLWSGTPDEAEREHLDRVRADLVAAFRKIVHRLRQRPAEGTGQ